MKKRVLSLVLVSIILFSVVFISAADLNSNPEAVACLKSRVGANCNNAQTTMAAAFSAMALGNNWTYQSSCKQVLMSKKKNGLSCWGEGASCDLKTTSMALLALNYLGASSSLKANITNWILTKEQHSSGLNWFLEIDHTGIAEDMSCSIFLNDGLTSDATVNVLESKQLSGTMGSCFELAESDYFLRIKSNCYNNNFTIKCTKGFLTTLLYKKQDNTDTYHISSTTNIAAENTETHEKIESICLGTQGTCDYEGSLWAAFALSPAGYYHEHSTRLLPYLITEESSNSQYFPPAFLYSITGNHANYLTKINNPQFYKVDTGALYYRWIAGTDEYHDTALGIYSQQKISSQEKNNAKETLIKRQGGDGCWSTSLGNNAFLLFAGWPESRTDAPSGTIDPEVDYQSCTDDDGGINNRTEGEVVEYFTATPTTQITNSDACINTTHLTEYYCNASNFTASIIIRCSFGCENGVCKNETPIQQADLCNLSDTKCSGTKILKTCGDWDDDQYLEWGNSTTCSYRCNNGACVNRSGGGTGTDPDYCTDAGFFCLAPAQCSQTNTLTSEDYFCGFPGDVCCNEDYAQQTCSQMNGIICPSGKACSLSTVTASDTTGCCKGTCGDVGPSGTETECEQNNGFCKASCFSDETESTYNCDFGKCCVSSTADEPGSNLWIIILLIILIILVVLAIIFRNQLKIWLFKIKSKFTKGKGPAPTTRPGFPPRPGMSSGRFQGRPRMPPQRSGIRSRQIIPRTGRPMSARRPASRTVPKDKAFDETMKKLKEMSK